MGFPHTPTRPPLCQRPLVFRTLFPFMVLFSALRTMYAKELLFLTVLTLHAKHHSSSFPRVFIFLLVIALVIELST